MSYKDKNLHGKPINIFYSSFLLTHYHIISLAVISQTKHIKSIQASGLVRKE